jgi:hypothetical protein
MAKALGQSKKLPIKKREWKFFLKRRAEAKAYDAEHVVLKCPTS